MELIVSAAKSALETDVVSDKEDRVNGNGSVFSFIEMFSISSLHCCADFSSLQLLWRLPIFNYSTSQFFYPAFTVFGWQEVIWLINILLQHYPRFFQSISWSILCSCKMLSGVFCHVFV